MEDKLLASDERDGDRACIGRGRGDRAQGHGDEDRPGHGEHGEQLAATGHGRTSPTITLVRTPME